MKVSSPTYFRDHRLCQLKTSLDWITHVFIKSLEKLRLFIQQLNLFKTHKISSKFTASGPETRNAQAPLYPAVSFLDLRALSPTIEVPTGFTNPSGNSFFHASLHFINHNKSLSELLFSMLEAAAESPRYDINPFFPSDVLDAFPHDKKKEFEKDIAKAEIEYQKLSEIDIGKWPLVSKINLQSLYFHLKIKKAAQVALHFLRKWQGQFDRFPHTLTSRESQLLRLSLVKLIYYKTPLYIEERVKIDDMSLGIPGISQGINPLSRYPGSSIEFINSLMSLMFHFAPLESFLKDRVYIEKKHEIFAAHGYMLGKKIRSAVKLEFLNIVTINAQANLDIGSALLKMQSKIDSRGVWQTRKNCFKPHPKEILDQLDLVVSGTKSQFHEIKETSLNIQKHLALEIDYPSYVKTHIFSFNFQDTSNYFFIFKESIFKLTCFLAEAGPNSELSKSIIYVLKESASRQKVFFKCDDLSITPTSSQTISQIFLGIYKDSIWGQVRPTLLFFEKISK
jgi:hypothetical protein